MSFRAWGPKSNKIFARSITGAFVTAIQPPGFAGGGGQVKVANTSTTVTVVVAFWKHTDPAGDPAVTFPADGAPPTGVNAGLRGVVAVVLPGQEKQISIPISADSFGAIGSAAGPTLILVQRGDGSV